MISIWILNCKQPLMSQGNSYNSSNYYLLQFINKALGRLVYKIRNPPLSLS